MNKKMNKLMEKCDVCERVFKHEKSLRSHQYGEHKMLAYGGRMMFSTGVPIENREQRFDCEFCFVFFKNREDLAQHMSQSHEEEASDTKRPRSEEETAVEGRKVRESTEKSRNAHKMEEKKKKKQQDEEDLREKAVKNSKSAAEKKAKEFKCEVCGEIFKIQRFFSGHMWKKHNVKRKFHCHKCDYSVTTEACLKLHVEQHKRVSLKCVSPSCSMTFASAITRNVHAKHVHGRNFQNSAAARENFEEKKTQRDSENSLNCGGNQVGGKTLGTKFERNLRKALKRAENGKENLKNVLKTCKNAENVQDKAENGEEFTESPYGCGLCRIGFKLENRLWEHLLQEHKFVIS